MDFSINYTVEQIDEIIQHFKNWSNENNRPYYDDEYTVEALKTYATRGGLDTYQDLKLVFPYILKASSILEIGAGYGRVIDYLLNLKFKKQLYAIERSPTFCKLLRKKYARNTINIIEDNIQTTSSLKPVDIVLWMWSGISDFSQQEQLLVIKKISTLINPQGHLIIETFHHTTKPINAIVSTNQSYVIPSGKRIVYGYIPSPQEIEKYAVAAEFMNVKHLEYQTTTGRPRNMYILSKE